MTTAVKGLPFLRVWHGDHLTRGRHVAFDGMWLATVLSAQGANVAVRVYVTGERLVVAPHRLSPLEQDVAA